LDKLKPSFSKLADPDKEIVLQGIKEIEMYLPGLKGRKFKQALSSLSGLFYIDTFERPDLQPVIDRAFETFKIAGAKAIPFLLSSTRESDFKFQLNLARALGKIGRPAIKPVLSKLNRSRDPNEKSLLLYSVGKIKDPAVIRAIPALLKGLKDKDQEVRDSAARTMGKVFEVALPSKISFRNRNLIFESLFKKISDESSGVRSKAVRSLGKMVKYGFADQEQEERLKKVVRRLLGQDESYNWDIAYIVRREAQEVYNYLSGKGESRDA
jgi:hypothetical protein